MKNTASILVQAERICHFCKWQKEIRGKIFTDAFDNIRKKMEVEFLAELADTLEYIQKNPEEFRPKYAIKKRLDNFFEVIFALAEKRIKDGFIPLFSEFFEEAQAESLRQSTLENWNIYISSEKSRFFAENKAAELVSHINETTRTELRHLISESWENGDTLPTLTEKITEKFTQFNAIRSALIAQQETSIIYENGKKKWFETAATKLGVTGWKKAITQGDLSVRDTHRQNALDGWIENDQKFSGTLHDIPPFGFWCRCTVVRKVDEPTENEKQKAKIDPFLKDLHHLAQVAKIPLDSVKKGKNEYWNLLKILSEVNRNIKKNSGKKSKWDKQVYWLKSKIILHLAYKIHIWEIQWRFSMHFDYFKKMPWITFKFWKNSTRFHIPPKIEKKIKTFDKIKNNDSI